MPTVTPSESASPAMQPPGSGKPARWRQTIFLLFLVGVCAVYALNWASPNFGLYYDDGLYVVTARALAQGEGYRITSLPNNLEQTKYPPAFPALLAAVWKLWPSFPDNLRLLKAVPILFGLLWAMAGVCLLRTMIPAEPARWIAVFTMAAGMVITANCSLLPDSFFAFMTTVSLLLLLRVETAAGGRMRELVLSAVCLALGLLARTMGLAFAIAAIGMLVWRKRFREAVVFGAICGFLYLPWVLWVRSRPMPPDPVYAGYSQASYRGGHILSSVYSNPQRMQMVATNLMLTATSATLLLPLEPAGPAGILLAIGISVAALYGFWISARQRLTMVHAWVLAFLGLLTIWAWPPLRYLIPVLLPLLGFAFLGAQAVLEKVSGRLPRFLWPGLAGLLIVCSAAQGYRISEGLKAYGYPVLRSKVTASWSDIEQAALWIRGLTPRNAVIAADTEIVFHLLSGRKAIRGFYYDAYDIFYGEVSGENKLSAENAAGMLRAHLKANGITHIVLVPLNQFLEDAFFRGAVFQLAGQGIVRVRRADLERGIYLYEVDSSRL